MRTKNSAVQASRAFESPDRTSSFGLSFHLALLTCTIVGAVLLFGCATGAKTGVEGRKQAATSTPTVEQPAPIPEDGQARLELAKSYLAQEHTLANEALAAKPLRKIIADQQEQMFDAFSLLNQMRDTLRADFPEISDARIERRFGSLGTGASIGWIIAEDGNDDLGVQVMLREAYLLKIWAQLSLQRVYELPIEGFKRYDPRILAFFEETAAEGLPQPRAFLGKIYLRGVGVPENAEKGIALLEASETIKGYSELGAYAYQQGNRERAQHYFRLAADLDSPDANYELAIFEQEDGRYEESVQDLQRCLDLAPDHHAARYELGRMYKHGWGVEQDLPRAFRLMKQVADEAEGRAVALAAAGVGICYLDGTGVEKSPASARLYLQKVKAAGRTDMDDLLKQLDDGI